MGVTKFDGLWYTQDDSVGPGGLQWQLENALTARRIFFDHVRIGFTGRSTVAVFVVKGSQAAVLYDKTRNFPSAKLMASLVLLGSP